LRFSRRAVERADRHPRPWHHDEVQSGRVVRSMKRIVILLVRILSAATIFVLGIFAIYAFAGGYFDRFALPSPLNVGAALLLLVGLISVIIWFLRSTAASQ
jgi:hypothetical protein